MLWLVWIPAALLAAVVVGIALVAYWMDADF